MKKLILLSLIPLFCFGLVYAKNFETYEIDSFFNNFYGISFIDYYNVEFPTKKIGMANPASLHCHELGYEYKIVETDKGQKGVCIFPDDSECEEWQFLTGKCGQEYSYCAKQGYDLIIKTDGNDPFSRHYTVCVHDQEEIGAVTELMSLSEKATRGSFFVEQSSSAPEEGVSTESLPDSFDWRNKDGENWMTRIKNQVDCGSCWAFATVGAVEAVHNIKEGDPDIDLDLSEEFLVSDCHLFKDIDNCCGGEIIETSRFIRQQGIPDDNCMPYASQDCICPDICDSASCDYGEGGGCSDSTCSDRCSDWSHRLIAIKEFGYVPNDPSDIKTELTEHGPVPAIMGFGNALIGGHWDGDIYRCQHDGLINHAVIIVGYNDIGGYWIIKNSMGIGFDGEPDPKDGYFYLGYGECDIENHVFYVSDTSFPSPPFIRVIECDGDCRDEGTANQICQTEYGTDWHATAVDCEGVEVPGADQDWDRTFDSNLDWCGDTGGEDLTVTCTDNPQGDYKVRVIECDGNCRDEGTPNDICGSGWYATAVDCEEVEVPGADQDWDRTFDSNLDWCGDTGGEDITVTCSNRLIGEYKVRVIDCYGYCGDDEGTPNDICGSNWHAVAVDCETVDVHYGLTYPDQNCGRMADSNLDWCEDTGGEEDLTVTCISCSNLDETSCLSAGCKWCDCTDDACDGADFWDYPDDYCTGTELACDCNPTVYPDECPTGTLEVVPNPVGVDETVDITVTGTDEEEVGALYAVIQGEWHFCFRNGPPPCDCPSLEECSKTWQTSYDSPGSDTIWGFVCGEALEESICARTDPASVTIKVNQEGGGGGCPHVYTWDGNEYVLDNNLLPFSEIRSGDVEDYYKLEKPLVEKDGKYSILIKEFEHEHDSFDQVKLIAIYHSPDFEIAVTPSGEILTYNNPIPSKSAVDNKGDDVLDILSSINENYYEGDKDDYIMLDFGEVDAKDAKLVMKADFRMPRMVKSIHAQIQVEEDGEWEDVAVVIPRNYWATEIIDLSNYVPTNREFKIRLYFTKTHKLDFVGLDTSEQADFEVKEAELISAEHSTKGDVKSMLKDNDDIYAELVPGEQVELEFTLPENKQDVRDFILFSEGHYVKIEENTIFTYLGKFIQILSSLFK